MWFQGDEGAGNAQSVTNFYWNPFLGVWTLLLDSFYVDTICCAMRKLIIKLIDAFCK